MFLRSQLLIARRTSWYRTHGSRLTAPLTLVHSPLFCLPGTERGQTSHANTSCVLINCLQRLYAHEAVIEKWHSFRRIKISLLLARRKAAQKAAAGLPRFVHVVCVNLAWLKGDTNNQGQESKRTNRCTSTPQETPKKTWVQQGPSYTKYDTCTGFDRNETAPPKKNRNIFWCGSAAGAHHHQ